MNTTLFSSVILALLVFLIVDYALNSPTNKKAHKLCAGKGHAPEIHDVQRLPGGYYMIVMDKIGEKYVDLNTFIDHLRGIRSGPIYAHPVENIQRFLRGST